ncbi:LOW QUALITY PROTEIN: Transcription activator BRG1 [Frankliniella fusca]|uniref:Transcription activator BRG1 n=1 Tax=Frankliniella fusca TaxID=407009 RepID=A0AAE1HEX2_9NEOP|nr:LOW QUALITY PROTEIN: Transcription activator BRG1 [Frankliniella fusca]
MLTIILAQITQKRKLQEKIENTRLSRIDSWKKNLKEFKRSKYAKLHDDSVTIEDIKEQRKHATKIRVRRSRELERKNSNYDETVAKRKKKQFYDVQETYENEIRELYSHVCNSCGKICKKNQVKTLKRSTLKQKGFRSKFIKKLFSVENSDSEEFCTTCVTYINRGKIPKLSLENGLKFSVVDEDIQKLNRIEERLLAPRHVFQTLWTVNGSTGQFKTKGGIVNVHVDMDTTVHYIPRAIDDSNMILVK